VAVKFSQMGYLLLTVAVLFFLFMCICLLSAMGRMNDKLKEEERRKKNKITGGGLQGW
jgi:Na+-transporting methylmalonyl-CoA/oxaloacetate decarboxylase gamma subunit